MTKAMENEETVVDETLNVQENGETSQNAPELTVEEIAELKKKADAYESQKIRAEKAEAKLNAPQPKVPAETDSIDLIKLGKKLQGYSDEELDFVTEHAKSKKPEDVLKALENPYIQMGIKAQREKVEKEKLSLRPSGKQSESDAPLSLEDALASAKDDKEREQILKDTYGYDVGSKIRKS